MLTLSNLSTDNIHDCLQLKVDSWQERYVRPIAEYIALAYVRPEQLIPLVITLAEHPVGFLQFQFDQRKNIIVIQLFMVDARFQSKGYATTALRQFVAYASTLEPYERIYCQVDMGNQIARAVLENAGFMRGHVDLENKLNEWVYIIR